MLKKANADQILPQIDLKWFKRKFKSLLFYSQTKTAFFVNLLRNRDMEIKIYIITRKQKKDETSKCFKFPTNPNGRVSLRQVIQSTDNPCVG